MTTEIKPCPFCGWDALRVQNMVESVAHPGNFFPEHVECPKCGIHYTGKDAKEKWNTRADHQNEALLAQVEEMAHAYNQRLVTMENYEVDAIFHQSPQQSLDSLKSRIEEETIERCADAVAVNYLGRHIENSVYPSIQKIIKIHRKYQPSTKADK